MLKLFIFATLLILTVNGQDQDFEHEDELSAPLVGDFLPVGVATTTTDTPTAPNLPNPVSAVPVGNPDHEQEDSRQVEINEELENVEAVDELEDVQEDGQVAQVEEAEEPVEQLEEVKPVEKVQQVKQPQKFSRLRVKQTEAKKQELVPEPKKPEVEEIGVEATPCDSAVYDCEGCAIPKQARNCRVKYFKDQGAIKACVDSGVIAKNVLDQCPAKEATEEK